MTYTSQKTNLRNRTFTFDSIIKFMAGLFIPLSFLVFGITGSDEQGLENSLLKYAVLMIGITFAFLSYLAIYGFSFKSKKLFLRTEFARFRNEFILLLGYTLIYFLFYSSFLFRSIKELFFMFIPIFYAFLVINIFDFKKLNLIIKVSFVVVFSCYLFRLNMNLFEIIKSLFLTNFFNSYSPLESSVFAGLANAFAFYFIYYKKNNKIFCFLSLLFVFMTFKRLAIIFVFFLFIFSLFSKSKNKSIKKDLNLVIFIGISVFFLLYLFMMLPQNKSFIENLLHIDLTKFTMNRNNRLKMLLENGYMATGFGSSTQFFYNHGQKVSLEMDLIKIVVEVGFIPCFYLIYTYLNFSRKNLYVYLIFIFEALNLIFASSLANTFGWMAILINVSTILKYPTINKVKEAQYEIFGNNSCI